VLQDSLAQQKDPLRGIEALAIVVEGGGMDELNLTN